MSQLKSTKVDESQRKSTKVNEGQRKSMASANDNYVTYLTYLIEYVLKEVCFNDNLFILLNICTQLFHLYIQ